MVQPRAETSGEQSPSLVVAEVFGEVAPREDMASIASRSEQFEVMGLEPEPNKEVELLVDAPVELLIKEVEPVEQLLAE